MPNVHFTGRVLPSVINVTVNSELEARWEAREVGLQMKFKPRIKDSSIDIECEVNRFRDEDMVHMYIRALDLARATVDLVAFAGAMGLTVFSDTLVKPDGSSSPIILTNDRLAPLCTSYCINSTKPEENAVYNRIYELITGEPGLFMALNDLIVAITLPHQAPVNSGRAIEGLRHLIAPTASPKSGWVSLRENLQLEKQYLEFVTNWSTGPRQGDRAYISGEITTEITKRAWIIMNRFLEFRKRGNQPLPVSEFPILAS
jgi:hypothetical protein